LDDFLFRGSLADLDPDVAALIDLEGVRQARRLIMIPSEATIPFAVRETLSSFFHNIYAEGYPPDGWRNLSELDLLDVDMRLAELRRNGGERYYQGTEVADIIESLARRRVAECFANERVSASQLYVNVQPLSGAPANSAVYTALMKPGDTLMGLDLIQGGHLTHGSPVARSGIQYNAVKYSVDPETERLNYDTLRDIARKHKPKIIVTGFTSYPFMPDWIVMRSIADEVGAYLLADMSHVAGLIAAKVLESPVGIADITMFTTHKTLGGPRGAVLVMHNAEIARLVDRGVFPGEQGGPHMNAIAGLAVAMKIAMTEQYVALQKQTVLNAKRLAERFVERGMRVPYGGTETHMVLLDVGKIGKGSTPLSGDMAARILEMAGIVANRNTIPGDKSPFRATGLRFGTPWITQRGFKEREIDEVANAIVDLLQAMRPFSYSDGYKKSEWRAKVDFDVLVDVQRRVRGLTNRAGIDYRVPNLSQHFVISDAASEHFRIVPNDDPIETWRTIEVDGPKVREFLTSVLTCGIDDLDYGDFRQGWILNPAGEPLAQVIVEHLTQEKYLLHVSRNIDMVAQWLISLSDGYIQFEPEDVYAKIPGPVAVSVLADAVNLNRFNGLTLPDSIANDPEFDVTRAYYIGAHGPHAPQGDPLPPFTWEEAESEDLLTTPVHGLHKALGAKMVPFAGYDMPVWYSGVSTEHQAVRQGSGLFDVTHMGVFEVSGTGAVAFLDALTTNEVNRLKPGKAHYSYLLGIDGQPLDDIFIYCLAVNTFMVVVNASNNDKDWAWINAVKDGAVAIDPLRPWAKAPGRDSVHLRDLRLPEHGPDRRVDLALQGPHSLEVLFRLDASDADKAAVKGLAWASVVRVNLGGHDLIVSRTGYTGERIAYEIFPHPDEAAVLFEKLVNAGATPCGLAARDSLRIEAGLPLYGHELAGPLAMNPADAGFGNFVKLWKPFFVGKSAYIAHEAKRDRICVRFRMNNRGVRPPHQGDPVVDARGRVVGIVTSCSIDSDGYQTGMALVREDVSGKGSPLLIYSNAARQTLSKPFTELGIGDKAPVPDQATILTRFPNR
jgi:glycine hydroxymethyltransferase